MPPPPLQADRIGDLVVLAGALAVILGEKLRQSLRHGISD
jgi:uncharacterized protein (DUF39 family)